MKGSWKQKSQKQRRQQHQETYDDQYVKHRHKHLSNQDIDKLYADEYVDD